MNRTIYSLLLGLSILLGTACKRESLMTYVSADNIYFDYIAGADPATDYLGRYTDSIELTFSFSDGSVQDSTIGIPVSVTGVAQSYDRTFRLIVDPSSTARPGVHYELPAAFVLPAGKIKDSVFIHFKRAADLKTAAQTLLLHLEDSDQLKAQLKFRGTNPRESNMYISDTVLMTSFRINLTDMLSAGPYWSMDYEYSFGTFSEKKVRLMNEIVGMPLDFWSRPATTNEQRATITYYGGFTARYLSDQAFAGNTILEADGVTPMKMGSRFP
ncbi:MAG: DUF4843 domain-containing protein [Candidatus Pseudobacter hemicellulosilyticus]|uniref:DUF4843 domain-containing protein n=1 Tax=Candidatus Pseudobacter hemicellulosilyticus TaxID=3121375 RepID=A0AAJ6BJM2_9BACT|nr:MAG: DUF4843 domain-containing protein [Pseudobacter sp.]